MALLLCMKDCLVMTIMLERVTVSFIKSNSEDDENAQNVGIYKIEIALESEVAEDNFIWDNPPNGIFVGGQN